MKKKYNLFRWLIVFVFVFVNCPYWALLYLMLLLLLFTAITFLLKRIINNNLRKLLKALLLFFFVFIITISVKLLMGDIYKIPSSSMSNTLYAKDVIFVNKLSYGPRLPRSPFDIPWITIAFYFNENAKKRIKENWWEHKRLSGTRTIHNGDVVVFTMFAHNMVIVKRCMAIAGDTLKIRKGDVYINNNYFNPSNLILNTYKFKVKNKKTFYKKLDSIGLNVYLSNTEFSQFKGALSFQDITQLEKLGELQDLVRITDKQTSKSFAYPNSEYNQWNYDNYGSFIIPKRGMVIRFTPENYALYSKVINEHEGVVIKKTKVGYMINGKVVQTYTFKQNYFFMMGDNRKDSADSRVWGLVPEERIIGKVQLVLWSNYQDEFQWDRLLKSVN